MNRPRDSVLTLFDPLKTPAPESTSARARNVVTPDSDKENSSPASNLNFKELTMTTFFSRTYGKKNRAPLPPVRLRKRLVDVGDVTVDEEVTVIERGNERIVVCLNEDREDSFQNDENDVPLHSEPTTPIPPTPRTPLADIALEHNPVNVARRKVYRREDFCRPPPASAVAVTLAPMNSPLAGIINSINFPSRLRDDERPEAVTPDISSPEIENTPPASAPTEPSSTAHLAPSSTPSLIANITISVSPPDSNVNESHILPRGALSQSSASTSFDLHGASVDLQSLFKAQEGSFDLLKDRMDVDMDMGGLESFLGAMDFNAPPEEGRVSASQITDGPSGELIMSCVLVLLFHRS
jgi:hypothetical protein